MVVPILADLFEDFQDIKDILTMKFKEDELPMFYVFHPKSHETLPLSEFTKIDLKTQKIDSHLPEGIALNAMI